MYKTYLHICLKARPLSFHRLFAYVCLICIALIGHNYDILIKIIMIILLFFVVVASSVYRSSPHPFSEFPPSHT